MIQRQLSGVDCASLSSILALSLFDSPMTPTGISLWVIIVTIAPAHLVNNLFMCMTCPQGGPEDLHPGRLPTPDLADRHPRRPCRPRHACRHRYRRWPPSPVPGEEGGGAVLPSSHASGLRASIAAGGGPVRLVCVPSWILGRWVTSWKGDYLLVTEVVSVAAQPTTALTCSIPAGSMVQQSPGDLGKSA